MSPSPATTQQPTFERGYAFLKNVISPAEIAAADNGQKELNAGRADREPAFCWPPPRARQARSRKIPYSSHFRSELHALTRSPRLLRAIAAETGAQSIRLWFDQLLWEAPAQASRLFRYSWHTERSRWKTCQSPLMVTAWLPLAPILPQMGPITLAQGTAKRGWLELPDPWTPPPESILPAPVQPGDAALFCWHTVHGNPPNLSPLPRRAIAIHYAIDALSYQPHRKFRHSNEQIVRLQKSGLPDFQDERVCPLVY